jgi:hypothetical protein
MLFDIYPGKIQRSLHCSLPGIEEKTAGQSEQDLVNALPLAEVISQPLPEHDQQEREETGYSCAGDGEAVLIHLLPHVRHSAQMGPLPESVLRREESRRSNVLLFIKVVRLRSIAKFNRNKAAQLRAC